MTMEDNTIDYNSNNGNAKDGDRVIDILGYITYFASQNVQSFYTNISTTWTNHSESFIRQTTEQVSTL